jgi:glycosyltransferase involved in cell wall biosynthesis
VQVSVVIPAHNAAATIARAVESVLAQSLACDEIIVVDDGSTDDTASIVRSFAMARTLILSKCSGAAAARNLGIEQAQGEFIAFLDADDEWLPHKTERQVSVIADQPGMTWIGCLAELVTASPGSTATVHQGRPFATGSQAWKTLLAYPFAVTSGVIARRADILRVGGFDPSLPAGEDQDLWIRLARCGEVGFVNEILVRYHDMPQSLTKQYRAETASLTLAVVERHIASAGEALSPAERRQIRGHRYARLGRSAYAEGDVRGGARLVLRAAALGHQPLRNLAYLALASPPFRPLKRWLKRLF